MVKLINEDSNNDVNTKSDDFIGLLDENTESEHQNDQNDQNDKTSKKTIFVRGLPVSADSDAVSDFFSEFGPVKHSTVVIDKETKVSKRFGFVTFASEKDALNALNSIKKKRFGKNIIFADFAVSRNRDSNNIQTSFNSQKNLLLNSDKNHEVVLKRKPRLIIRNLPWSIRKPDDLKPFFEKYGTVTDIIIPRGKNGRMSGFAFVTMKKEKNAEDAIKGNNGIEISGRKVAVDYALQKNEWMDALANDDHDNNNKGNTEKNNNILINDNNNSDASISEPDLSSSSDDDDDTVENDSDEDVTKKDKEIEQNNENSLINEEKNKVNRNGNGNGNGLTVFVRNLPYSSTSDALAEHFEQFGRIRYALPVIDKDTKLPKGTGFVRFIRKADADKCVSESPVMKSDENSDLTKSVLVGDNADSKYIFEGRILHITKAIEREEAESLTRKNIETRQGKNTPYNLKDKRNIFLLAESVITPSSALGQLMSSAELEMREKSFYLRKKQLDSNPTLHLSLVRLAIRNIPKEMTSKGLKALARKAVVQFASEANAGLRNKLTKEEVHRSALAVADVPKSKRHGVVRQAKIIYDDKATNTGKSRCYGFVEFSTHRWALMGLRWLNGHAVTVEELSLGEENEEKTDSKDKENKSLKVASQKVVGNRRLIAEFAVENIQVVKRRREREKKDRERAAESKENGQNGHNEDENNEETGEGNSNKKTNGKRKFNNFKHDTKTIGSKHNDNDNDNSPNKKVRKSIEEESENTSTKGHSVGFYRKMKKNRKNRS